LGLIVWKTLMMRAAFELNLWIESVVELHREDKLWRES
jgi:hypothetical protein